VQEPIKLFREEDIINSVQLIKEYITPINSEETMIQDSEEVREYEDSETDRRNNLIELYEKEAPLLTH